MWKDQSLLSRIAAPSGALAGDLQGGHVPPGGVALWDSAESGRRITCDESGYGEEQPRNGEWLYEP